jgi:hypothetical protein
MQRTTEPRNDKVRKWILSLVSAVVISVWADVKAYNHGIFADTGFHIAVLFIQAGIVVVLLFLIVRGIAADRRDRGLR